jgi:hypothetical protein
MCCLIPNLEKVPVNWKTCHFRIDDAGLRSFSPLVGGFDRRKSIDVLVWEKQRHKQAEVLTYERLLIV